MNKTNSIGEGMEMISFTINQQDAEALKALVEKSGMSRSAYCRKILLKAVEGGTYFQTEQISSSAPRQPLPDPVGKRKGSR